MLWLRRFIFGFPVAICGFFLVAFLFVRDKPAQIGNVLTIGSIGEPENVNPIRATTTAASEVTGLVFDSLVLTDENLNLIGGLAESCRIEQVSRLFFDQADDAAAVAQAARALGETISLVETDVADGELTLRFRSETDLLDPDAEPPPGRLFDGAGTGYQGPLKEALERHVPRPFWHVSIRPLKPAFPDGAATGPEELERRAKAALEALDARVVQTYTVLGSTVELAGHGPLPPVRRALRGLFNVPTGADDGEGPGAVEGEQAKVGGGEPLAELEFAEFLAQDRPIFSFRLRRGVRWHPGRYGDEAFEAREFTSADCVFTYEKLIDPQVASRRAPDFVLVESVDAPDEHTFRVTYKKPYSSALISWAMDVLPRHVLAHHDVKWWAENFDRAPLGTGPFRFQHWQRGERMVLVRNEDYWKGPPNLERVNIRYIPDQLNIKLALETGEIDFYSVDPHAVGRFRRMQDQFTLYEFLTRSYNYIGWNLRKELFQDVRVRTALAHAVNVPQMIEYMLYGHAVQSRGCFNPQFWFANPDIQPVDYDPEKARALLAEAGWTQEGRWLAKDGKRFEFDLITNQGNDIRKDISVLVQADLEKIGVKVNLNQYEWTVFIERYINKRAFDACVLGWALGIDYDQYQLWHSSQAEDGLNHCSYRSPEVDRLLEAIRTTYDPERLRELTWKLQEVIYRDQPYLWLYVPKAVVAVHKDRFRVHRPLAPGGAWIEEPIRQVPAGFTHHLHFWYRTDHPPARLRHGQGVAP